MAEENGDRIESLFHQATDLPPEQRQAFLDRACANEPDLHAALERLLADDARLSDDEDTPFLASPFLRAPVDGAAGTAHLSSAPPLPEHLGRYRLLRLLGQGGMGAVYEAEQDDPRRIVALKVVRPGLASPSLLKRFRHESQILGRLHHSGIAQVYEAGLANDGQPFFAMEFIQGLPLDEFARLHARTLEARGELLARVCDAVQHAHEQGVVHRDLKPTNILVEEAGQPKVLDFGVARVTDVDVLTEAALTQTGQFVGTPNYMSPEQVSGDPATIDCRADVYALGVILFELAAHRLPFRLENRPFAETARLILEEDPPKLGSIDLELRGDVETIVSKALEKDRARRYASAAELAADLRRWLAHKPIQARPPSALYHMRKFARRHRGLVGGAAATGLALIAGTVFSLLFAFGEARQRQEADRARGAALRETYQARLAAAAMALREGNFRTAEHQLDAAPPELRGWEWQHLRARVSDLSPVVLEAPEFDSLMEYFPPGKRLLARKGNKVVLADLQTRAVLREVCDASSFRDALASSGFMLAYARPESGTMLLDETGAQTNIPVTWEGGNLGHSLSASEDRKLLAVWNRSSPSDRWLRLFELPSGRLRLTIERPERLRSVAFSPDGTRVAGGSKEPDVFLWDAATGATTLLHGHTAQVNSVAFHPDGKRLVSGSSDGTIRQWDVGAGQPIDVRRGHRRGVTQPIYMRDDEGILGVRYSPDGQWIASSGYDTTVRIWKTYDSEPPTVLPDHEGSVHDAYFSPDGFTISTTGENPRQWRTWLTPAATDRLVLRGHSSYVYPVVHSPDGRLLASAGWDNDQGIRLWDATSGALLAVLTGHKYPIFSLAFSPDSRRLVSRSDDATLRVWDAETGAALAVLPCDRVSNSGAPQSVVVTPDGRTILTGTDKGLRRWDLATGAEQGRIPLPLINVRALAVRPQDGLLAASGDGPNIILVDTGTGESRAVLTIQPGRAGIEIHSLAFSPDGRQLISAGNARDIQVWDVASGKLVRELHGHSDEVFAAIFHPDGRRIVSAGRDRIIRVWDPATGDEMAQLLGHTNYIFSLSFSPDGTTLASGSGDTTVRLWETERLGRRLDALREEQSLRSEAERLVERRFRELGTADKVVESFRADRVLSEAMHQAAFRAVLRRTQPPGAQAPP